MLPTAAAPSLNDKGSPALNYEQQVRFWRREANLGPAKRASAFFLQMDVVARQVCKAAGSDAFMNGDDAERILNILREYPVPAAVDSVNQDGSDDGSLPGRV